MSIGYLCWRVGIPFDSPFIEYLTKNVDLSRYYTGYEKMKQLLGDFREKYLKKDPEVV